MTEETESLHVPQNTDWRFPDRVCSGEPSYLLYEHAYRQAATAILGFLKLLEFNSETTFLCFSLLSW